MLETWMASPRFRDTGRFVRRKAPTKTFTPANLADLMRCLDPASKAATPIRIRGAGTASTDCNSCSTGTIIETTRLDRIVGIDTYNHTVTTEAGVRLGELVAALAEQGLELIGNHDQMERS
jgi:FAD/FMN-containing dehydrogenase